MAQAIPYLGFDGTCAEAMRLYEGVLGLGATLEMMLRGADTPMAPEMPPDEANRIVHARLRFDDGSYIFAGDAPACMPYDGIKGITITMTYPTVAEAQRVFEALAEGGTVTMAFAPAFYAKGAGMLVDRFGTPWAINGEVTM
ncbi:VOC family protein [Tropicimonas isoalkanivorans]|uniref:PhnB protein n=1 Tax=Tropicimonas isoalkanivorans TaxID=441112 RepID=A0A1I1IIH6_9RHOB|nr:VOC family protein [Tropicimonas isoalkanivorans]SFC33583.1 PhnB protein [Tropicimonas isoalkanivorans]